MQPGRNQGLRARTSSRTRLRIFLCAEFLESRQLLSTTGVILPAISSAVILPAVTTTTAPLPSSLTPAQTQQAYGVNQIKFKNGTITGDGSGQTIAIVDAYNDPNIATDLAYFSNPKNSNAQFSLPQMDGTGGDPTFTTVGVDQKGLPVPLSSISTDAGWSLEISLDVEWAHAIAPKANILLVEAKSSSNTDLLAAVDYASAHASVVSMSWGGSEFSGQSGLDSHFQKSGVTFVAASGDDGGINGPQWPAVSPNVVAVGGTKLTVRSNNGTYVSETGWSGSTGGVSSYFGDPYYQYNAFGGFGGRAVPDVAYNADPRTGFAVYDSTAYNNHAGWFQVGGTSAGAPQVSAIIAIANQLRTTPGVSNLGLLDSSSPQSSNSNVLKLVYGLAWTEYSSSPSPYFHDITTGYNSYYSAGQGYDAVTGLGSPIANALVSYLVTGQQYQAPHAAASAPITSTANMPTSSAGIVAPHAQVFNPMAVAVISLSTPISGNAQTTLFLVPITAPAQQTSAAAHASSSTALTDSGSSVAPARPVQPTASSIKVAADRSSTSDAVSDDEPIEWLDVIDNMPAAQPAIPATPAPTEEAAPPLSWRLEGDLADFLDEGAVAQSGASLAPSLSLDGLPTGPTLEAALAAGVGFLLWEVRAEKKSDRRSRINSRFGDALVEA